MIGLFLIFACEAPRPLPPLMQPSAPPHAQMVKVGEVSGFLVEGGTTSQGIVLLVEATDERARARALSLTPSTVLAIPPTVSSAAATAYLKGIKGIKDVTVLCDRSDCPGVNSEAGPPSSPARKLFPGRGQQGGR